MTEAATPAKTSSGRPDRFDKRLLLIYLAFVIALCGLGVVEHQTAANCRTIDQANVAFNRNLDLSITSTGSSIVLTPEQKAQRIRLIQSFHLPVVPCPVW